MLFNSPTKDVAPLRWFYSRKSASDLHGEVLVAGGLQEGFL